MNVRERKKYRESIKKKYFFSQDHNSLSKKEKKRKQISVGSSTFLVSHTKAFFRNFIIIVKGQLAQNYKHIPNKKKQKSHRDPE